MILLVVDVCTSSTRNEMSSLTVEVADKKSRRNVGYLQNLMVEVHPSLHGQATVYEFWVDPAVRKFAIGPLTDPRDNNWIFLE
jgi:hypothetical protein